MLAPRPWRWWALAGFPPLTPGLGKGVVPPHLAACRFASYTSLPPALAVPASTTVVFELAPGGHATGVDLATLPGGPSTDIAVTTGVGHPLPASDGLAPRAVTCWVVAAAPSGL